MEFLSVKVQQNVYFVVRFPESAGKIQTYDRLFTEVEHGKTAGK